MTEPHSLHALYETGVGKLTGAGIAEAALDARLLLTHVTGLDHTAILSRPEQAVEASLAKDYLALIAKRADRVPLAYLTKEQAFMGRSFNVTPDVLIPNPDTEIVVEEALRHLHDGFRFLDLCTGSGCIALSLLSYSNDTFAVATDCSEAALTVARGNADALQLGDRIRFECADLFPATAEPFDFLISNPPYVQTGVIETLADEVRVHEPRLALDGGADGLAFYRRIAARAGAFLRKEGMLYLEIGYDQADAVCTLLADAGFRDLRVLQDLSGLDRVVTGMWR